MTKRKKMPIALTKGESHQNPPTKRQQATRAQNGSTTKTIKATRSHQGLNREDWNFEVVITRIHAELKI
ncbi:MAG: hypothetical protein ACFE8O_09985 [Candidatus Hermodarchaeota archaeon]